MKLVFDRNKEHNLKLSPGKCSFFMPKVRYVEHIVSEAGIETNPEKIEKNANWPKPQTAEDARRFNGFAVYYRRFINNFSHISKALTDIMPSPQKKSNKKKKHIQKPWKWGDDQEKVFNKLKEHLSSTPIIGYPDYKLPFELHTDASGICLGAVLYQYQGGLNRPLAFASRGLIQSDKNYPALKLEFLAMKWAICDKFKSYLFGNTFRVLTDNNPLTYVLTTANLDAKGHRCLAAVGAFNFEIANRPGKNNADADSLSRLVTPSTISTDSIKNICQTITIKMTLVETMSVSPDVLESQGTGIDMSLQMHNDLDWVSIQQNDSETGP